MQPAGLTLAVADKRGRPIGHLGAQVLAAAMRGTWRCCGRRESTTNGIGVPRTLVFSASRASSSPPSPTPLPRLTLRSSASPSRPAPGRRACRRAPIATATSPDADRSQHGLRRAEPGLAPAVRARSPLCGRRGGWGTAADVADGSLPALCEAKRLAGFGVVGALADYSGPPAVHVGDLMYRRRRASSVHKRDSTGPEAPDRAMRTLGSCSPSVSRIARTPRMRSSL